MTELEHALDELYGVDLDEFTETRKRLAQELRAAGKKGEAAAVSAARKPVVSAWALNQLARRERRNVDLLLAAGHRLRQAQSSLLRGGEKGEFESARDAEEAAIAPLTEAARVLLDGERGGTSPGAMAQIGATLRAAAVGDEGRALLARGRFEKPIASEGFEILGALAPAGTARPETPRKKDDRRAEAIRQAKAALRAAQGAERQREREAQEAKRTAGRLRHEWETAEQQAAAAREDAEAAVRATAAAQRLLDEAQGP